jgi:hypothetical protein
MVSVPFFSDRNDVASVFGDDLGAYDNTVWRMFELKADQSYGEVSGSTPMIPGKAFWLIVKDAGKVIDTGPGKSVSTATPYTIPLHAQWNLIGNPYTFPVPVNRLTLANSGAVVLHSYEGAWNNPVSNPVTAIEPFTGYALEVSSVTTLNVNGDLSTGPLPRTGSRVENRSGYISSGRPSPGAGSPQSYAPDMDWWVGIEARCEEALDVDNVAMAAPAAERGRDVYDLMEPPVIGEYVTVRFPHPEWGVDGGDYCVDARPDVTQGEVWEAEVKTARKGRVELRFTRLADVPYEYTVLLMDEAVRVQQDLRANPAYRFESGGEGLSRRFSLIVGRHEDVQRLVAARGGIPQVFALLPNFPNPFNPVTTIVYALPSRADVSIRVYSVLGQEVSVLHEGVAEAGYWSAEFDARGLSSGTYIVRIRAVPVEGGGEFAGVQKMLLVK